MARAGWTAMWSLIFVCAAAHCWGNETPAAAKVTSPSGRLQASIALRGNQLKGASSPQLQIRFDGQSVVEIPIGLRLDRNRALLEAASIGQPSYRDADERYQLFPGKVSQARNHFQEAALELKQSSGGSLRWQIVMRAYDDGVAFRLQVPEQPELKNFEVLEEICRFQISAGKQAQVVEAWALPLSSFTTSYENKYVVGPLDKLPTDTLIGLPLLVKPTDGPWIAITEADLRDYPGMYLQHAKEGGSLGARLSPLPGKRETLARCRTPFHTPWRVIMLGDDPGRFIESTLVTNLNPRSRIEDTSWIKPGKTTFPWWNDYALTGVDFKPGLNTATMKHYIDFCSKHGIPYHSLDGYQDTAWYGGKIVPYEGADIAKALPEIDLPEVIRYAKEKNVRLRLWMHWQAAQKHMQRVFPLYEQWGIEGVMVDFMDRDDQEMVNFYHRLAELAAKHHLTVTLHGAYKPTGMSRTWPNVLNYEGVLNLEYNKWDPKGVTPDYELIIAFTRMLAGPLDFHQGSFQHVSPADYRPRHTSPQTISTRARTLATYVVLENHLPMVADSPSVYEGQAELPFLVDIPETWDETRVLSGEVGKYTCIARRQGSDWYLAALNDGHARKLSVALSFLGSSDYQMKSYADDVVMASRSRPLFAQRRTTANETLNIELLPAGGFCAKLTPSAAQ
jgi:alpha-glucosidase